MPYRVTRYRLLLVKDGSVHTSWDRQVRQPRDVADFMAPLAAGLDREHFWCLALDGKNRASSLHVVSIGSLTAALVHPRELAKALIVSNSAAAIVVHQHPSGSPEPSREDEELTRRLAQVGELIGVKLLDHVVLGDQGTYVSLADRGLLR